MRSSIVATLSEAESALKRFINDDQALASIEQAARLLIESFKAGGKVISCGNGGSMCDAMHFAEELAGRFRGDRPALPAVAVSDPGFISCTANDYGYAHVFSRFIEAHGKSGDCLLAISTSGASENVLQALRVAAEREVKVIALTGRADSPIGRLATVEVCAHGGDYADRSQELHIKIIHILIELVERSLCPENYAGD